MKGGSGIGEHTQTWSMMVIVGATLRTCMHFILRRGGEGSVTTSVHSSLTMTLKTNMALYRLDR